MLVPVTSTLRPVILLSPLVFNFALPFNEILEPDNAVIVLSSASNVNSAVCVVPVTSKLPFKETSPVLVGLIVKVAALVLLEVIVAPLITELSNNALIELVPVTSPIL